MNSEELSQYLLSYPDAWLDYPFGEHVAVYKIGNKDEPDNPSSMFAVFTENKVPLRISLRCDPLLAKVLRDKYVEVMPAEKLSKRDWNTIVLSGQLDWEEIKGLIRHSYDLTLEHKK